MRHSYDLGPDETRALIGPGVFDFGPDWRQCDVMLLLLSLQSRSRVIDQCILFDVY